jgi:hypothetical protein
MEHASLVIAILLFVFVWALLRNTKQMQQGRKIELRRLPGLEMIDEVICQATEQDRPIMFNTGSSDLGVDLFCAMAVMAHVVRQAATLSMPVLSAFAYPLAYAMGEEYWKTGYAARNKEGMFPVEECLRYLSNNASAYGTSIASWMKREKVGAHFMFGFYAYEAMVIAEGGQQAGAIQIACTPCFFQVPFLMVSCDYVVFGEEYYVAGAYYSQEPQLLGSLVTQDLAKLVVLALIISGTIMLTVFRQSWLAPLLYW